MLYLVGLGLADERDITVRGLAVVQAAARVYLEAYTSILLVPKERLVPSPPHAHSPTDAHIDTQAQAHRGTRAYVHTQTQRRLLTCYCGLAGSVLWAAGACGGP
jgi:hypothetical protein